MRFYEHGGDVYTNDGIRLDFSVNTNPLGMPESVKQAIIGHIPEYAHYPDPACRALRSALAARRGLYSRCVPVSGPGGQSPSPRPSRNMNARQRSSAGMSANTVFRKQTDLPSPRTF